MSGLADAAREQEEARAAREEKKSKELTRWADPAMFGSEAMPEARPRVFLLSATPDPLGSIAAMAKMYKGEVVRNLADVSDEERQHFWEESQKTHLRAPHEAVDFHFMIEGVTRAFTHQMVRQRTAVYAQESLRFAVKENLQDEVPLPPSILAGESADPSIAAAIWESSIENTEAAYKALIDMGVPAEDARGLLPHSVTTRLHYKTNLRNLVEHAGNRLCTQAQFEWRFVLAEIVKAIREYQGNPFAPIHEDLAAWQWETIANSNLFRPVCFAAGRCPFQADFDRGCTIRERMDSGRSHEVADEEWLLDPAAARRGG